MLFSSAHFLYAFLPCSVLILFLARSTKSRRVVITTLIGLSIIYYMYWNPPDILFVIATIVVNFAVTKTEKIGARTKIWLCVAFNASYLIFFKILVSAGVGGGADIDSGGLFSAIGLPLGISFITFQQITFVIDNAEGKDRERSFLNYAFFVMFFPQLVSGPIVKHSQLLPQTYRKHFLRFSWGYFGVGFTYFGIGIAKKVLLADPMADFNSLMFANTGSLTIVEAWLNVFIYSLRIYFDFSSYADMAIGLGYMLGLRLPKNFNAPYKSSNISEFWKRWHITLYHFFREYVFKRLVVQDFFSRHTALAVLIVFIISGLWHGFGLGFLAWALGHFACMLVYRNRRTLGIAPNEWFGNHYFRKLTKAASVGFMFVIVTILWLPFATNSITQTGAYFSRMVNIGERIQLINLPLADLNDLTMLAVGLVIVFFGPTSHKIALGRRKSILPLAWASLMIAASAPMIISRPANEIPFLYFNF